MDSSVFDRLVRRVGAERTRRAALQTALGGAAVAVAGLGSPIPETAAKKKKRCKPKGLGETCTANKQCCANETNRICFLKNGSPDDATRCCGGLKATCTGTNDCCNAFDCFSGSCEIAA